jgi:flagellar hook protein FlgE
MSFNTALSGIRAAAKDLAVTGNNIANASTTGFKSSRAEFGDLYASTVLGSGANATGNGVRLQDVAQNFKEGNISFTENNLDLAISGSGFFMANVDGESMYTRAGTFGLDDQGYIVNNAGGILQGFPADTAGNITGLRGDLRIETSNLAPRQTSQVQSVYNLDAAQPVLDVVFNPVDPSTYNSASSMNVYDSLGNPHVMTQYFVRQENIDSTDPDSDDPLSHWTMYVQIDDRNIGEDLPQSEWPAELLAMDPGEQTAAIRDQPHLIKSMASFDLLFNANGTLNAGSDAVRISNWDPVGADGTRNGAQGGDPDAEWPIPEPPVSSNFAVDLTGTTQFNEDFGEYRVSQDGYTTGRLSSLNIDGAGLIYARFTNGQSQSLGQIVLANFPNEQGLDPRGDTMWAQSMESGVPSVGIPGTSSLGAIQSGALEDSNVDLSEQLVNLIVAQRNFQASAKTIETADQTTQAIINLR